ncbi:MAG: hypothetical protein EBU92_10540 [Betaproteobacteria bacterium]|nr:hypothetical protein [Betaproteobacteria bacterium]
MPTLGLHDVPPEKWTQIFRQYAARRPQGGEAIRVQLRSAVLDVSKMWFVNAVLPTAVQLNDCSMVAGMIAQGLAEPVLRECSNLHSMAGLCSKEMFDLLFKSVTWSARDYVRILMCVVDNPVISPDRFVRILEQSGLTTAQTSGLALKLFSKTDTKINRIYLDELLPRMGLLPRLTMNRKVYLPLKKLANLEVGVEMAVARDNFCYLENLISVGWDYKNISSYALKSVGSPAMFEWMLKHEIAPNRLVNCANKLAEKYNIDALKTLHKIGCDPVTLGVSAWRALAWPSQQPLPVAEQMAAFAAANCPMRPSVLMKDLLTNQSKQGHWQVCSIALHNFQCTHDERMIEYIKIMFINGLCCTDFLRWLQLWTSSQTDKIFSNAISKKIETETLVRNLRFHEFRNRVPQDALIVAVKYLIGLGAENIGEICVATEPKTQIRLILGGLRHLVPKYQRFRAVNYVKATNVEVLIAEAKKMLRQRQLVLIIAGRRTARSSKQRLPRELCEFIYYEYLVHSL